MHDPVTGDAIGSVERHPAYVAAADLWAAYTVNGRRIEISKEGEPRYGGGPRWPVKLGDGVWPTKRRAIEAVEQWHRGDRA